MKNKSLICLSLIILTLFSSCSKKDKEREEKISRDVNSFIFELARYSLTGECDLENPQNYFYPKLLDLYAGCYIFENGQKYPLIEKYFPYKKGVIQGSGFYYPEKDDGSWVDALLLSLEEQRIAGMIEEMEDEYLASEYIPPKDDFKKGIDEALDENAIASEKSGKDSKLKIMQFNNEIFIPYEKGNSKVFIDANGTEVNRKFYDENFRLLKNEIWKISSINDAVLKQSEEYLFEGEEFKPSEKTITSDSDFTHTFYNENGLAIKTEKYKIVESKKSTQKVIVSVFEWFYNDASKIEKEANTVYYYDKDYKKLDYTFQKKHIYTYNDFTNEISQEDNDKIPADFEYYENDILKMKNKYTAELGTYTSQVFFDNDFSVKTTYNKYKRVKEVYTSGSEVIRINEYE